MAARGQACTVQGELPAQPLDFSANHAQRAIVVRRLQRAREELADDVHLGFAHAARRDRRRADADAARDHRRILIERDRVLVDRDARLAQRRLRHFAGDPLGEDIDEHEVVVGAAADEAEARGGQHTRELFRVRDDLLLVGDERRLRRFLEAHRFGCDDVHQRTALHAGEHGAIEILCVLLAAQHQTAPRSPQRLVGRRRDEVGVRDRAGMDAGRDEARDVGHVGEDRRADAIRRLPDACEIDDARIRAGADDDHLRTVFVGEAIDLVVVDPLVRLAHAVRDDRVELAGEVERVAVRQVAAVREVHPEHRVAWLQQRQIDRHVGLRAGVRLHVGVIGAEQRGRTGNRCALGHINELASAVVALSRVAFGVLVRHHRTGGFEHRPADEILRRDQLEAAVLTVQLVTNRGGDFGIGLGERAPYRRGRGVGGHRSLARLKPRATGVFLLP